MEKRPERSLFTAGLKLTAAVLGSSRPPWLRCPKDLPFLATNWPAEGSWSLLRLSTPQSHRFRGRLLLACAMIQSRALAHARSRVSRGRHPNGLPTVRNSCTRFLNPATLCGFSVSHSHITATRQPSRRSAKRFWLSLAALPSNFCTHHSRRLVGVVQFRHPLYIKKQRLELKKAQVQHPNKANAEMGRTAVR